MNFDKIKEVIADTVSIEEAEITLDADLKEDLGIDSLDAVEISIALEEAFAGGGIRAMPGELSLENNGDLEIFSLIILCVSSFVYVR